MIDTKIIDEIRDKTDIIAIVSEFAGLRQRGKNFVGLCPFHPERTPSFTVSFDRQMFHCFGCGVGGNVFTFLMKINNIEFVEAVEFLAERLGIHIDKTKISKTAPKSEKDKIYNIIRIASKYFENMFMAGIGEGARNYVKSRNFSDLAVKTFKVGFATDSWDGLYNYLTERGFNAADIAKAGLVVSKEDGSGYYDRFRNRLMFTICDALGREVAFGGRTLGADDAKYINSPDSIIFSKGNLLYGLNITSDAIKSQDFAILVEGYVDLITCYQNGIKNVVAPLGTALTEPQARLLRRFTENVVLIFDSDLAGIFATERGVGILSDAGLNVKIATLINGKDPDEVINKYGEGALLNSIQNAMPWVEYKIRAALKKYSISEIEGKSKAIKDVCSILGSQTDAVMQSEYIKLASNILHIEPELILAEVRKHKYYSTKAGSNLKRIIEKPKDKIYWAEQMLIRILLENKDALNDLGIELLPEDFANSAHKQIADLLRSNSVHALVEGILDEEGKKMLSKILLDDTPALTDKKAIMDCVRTLKVHHLRSQVVELKKQIDQAEKEGRIDCLKELFAEFNKYSELIRTL